MVLTRWTPRDLGFAPIDWADGEVRMIHRMFDDVVRTFDGGWEGSEEGATLPRMDLLDANDEYVMRADLPGLRREDVEIDVAPDYVTVRGHHAEEEKSDGCVVCRERAAGSFERTLPFPGEVRVEDVKASMKDGLLTVHLPKAHTANIRRIELTDH